MYFYNSFHFKISIYNKVIEEELKSIKENQINSQKDNIVLNSNLMKTNMNLKLIGVNDDINKKINKENSQLKLLDNRILCNEIDRINPNRDKTTQQIQNSRNVEVKSIELESKSKIKQNNTSNLGIENKNFSKFKESSKNNDTMIREKNVNLK